MKKKKDYIKIGPLKTNDGDEVIIGRDYGICAEIKRIRLKPQTKKKHLENLNSLKESYSNDTFENNIEEIKSKCLEIVKGEIGKSIIKSEEHVSTHPNDCPTKVHYLDGYILKSEPPLIVFDAIKTLDKIFCLHEFLRENDIKNALNYAIKIGSAYENIDARKLDRYVVAGKKFFLQKSKNAEECRKALIDYLKDHPKQGITKARGEIAKELGVSMSTMLRHTGDIKQKK